MPLRNHLGRRPAQRRRGVALAIVLVMLAMVALLALALTSAHMATRRLLVRRHHGRQADYLARAGVELAVTELLAGRDAGFRATYRPTDTGQVEVAVNAAADDIDQVVIQSAAVYPDEGLHRAGREIRRVYRIVRNEQGAPLQCVFVSGRPIREPQFVRADDPRRRVDPEKIHAARLSALRRTLQRTPGAAPPGASAAAPKKNMLPGRNLGGPSVVPLLEELLKDDDPAVRALAAQALHRFGPDARAALPALREATKDDDASVRQAATKALKEIGSAGAKQDDAP